LVVVQPATMIRWHRAGWRLLWRMKSRAGRPPIQELRELIRRMSRENVLWGEERIANELLLKLGIRISPRTVRKYLPKRPIRALGLVVLRSPFSSPKANAICERIIGTIRRECL
jgi:putative transposase